MCEQDNSKEVNASTLILSACMQPASTNGRYSGQRRYITRLRTAKLRIDTYPFISPDIDGIPINWLSMTRLMEGTLSHYHYNNHERDQNAFGMKTAPAEAALPVELGNGTYGSVCVAFGGPEDDRLAVTGSVPSAIFQ